MDLTKIDIEILDALRTNNMTSEFKSYRIVDICDTLACEPTHLTVSRHIRDKLIPNKYVARGVRDSRSYTYYITAAGLAFLNEKGL